jgi:hypothetical protein
MLQIGGHETRQKKPRSLKLSELLPSTKISRSKDGRRCASQVRGASKAASTPQRGSHR